MQRTLGVWAVGVGLGLCGCGGASSADVAADSSGGIDSLTADPSSSGDVVETSTTAASSGDDASSSGPAEGTTGATSASSSGGPGTSTGDAQSETTGGTTVAVLPETSGSTMDCPSAEVQFEPIIPTVILLIDQSGSMTAGFDGSNRWDVVREALIDPDTGVIAALQDDVRFGLALYTSNGGDAGGACPVLVEEAPVVASLDAITATYEPESPTGDTPTGDSIDAVVEALAADLTDGPKIIVLATDGEPDTCEVPNPQEGQVEAVTAAENAYTDGIETFVISVGNDVSETHLQDMANAGVGWMPGDADAPFYVPSDADAMVAAFEEIINGVRSCVLTLDTAILPGQADQGTVTVNGMEVTFDDPNGWQVNSPTEIELLGTSCEAIQEGNVEVTVEFTCAAIVPG
ncbi:MAG: vWA domain-containing protein [Nannocystales bacterium]